MRNQSHVADLLEAAKLLADAESNSMLSYLICMALLEARSSKSEAEKKAA